jgi:hypothetical protein
MNTDKTNEIREQIIQILENEFPSTRSNSTSKIQWSVIEKKYKDVDSDFKATTLRRYLGYIEDDNTKNSTKYSDYQTLSKIKDIIEGRYRKEQENILMSSSNTTNFQGYYLILSPSSVDGMLNLFPLEILPNGDFELNYVHYGDIIKGISSFNANHISLYANRKYNSTTKSYLPFCLHSVFNVQASNSRNDLQPFNLGVATRRKRNTAGLKAVMEVLIKIEKPIFDAFEGTALTLEKDSDSGKLYLLKGTKDYLDELLTTKFLQFKIEVDAKAEKGTLKLIEKELEVIVNEFYNFLIADNENNAINLGEKEFVKLTAIENKLKNT